MDDEIDAFTSATHGRIYRKSIPLPFGKFRDEFILQHGATLLVDRRIVDADHTTILRKQRFVVGPYHLRLLDYQADRQAYLTVLDSRFAWLTVARYRVGRLAEDMYCRAILTLYVWGLAEFEPGDRVGWRNIKALRRLDKRAKWWGKRVMQRLVKR